MHSISAGKHLGNALARAWTLALGPWPIVCLVLDLTPAVPVCWPRLGGCAEASARPRSLQNLLGKVLVRASGH